MFIKTIKSTHAHNRTVTHTHTRGKSWCEKENRSLIMIFPTDRQWSRLSWGIPRTIFAFGVAPYRITHHPRPLLLPPTVGPSSVLIPSVHFHVYLYLCVTQRNYTTFLLRHFSFGYLAIGFTSLLHFCGHPASATTPPATPKSAGERCRAETEPEIP